MAYSFSELESEANTEGKYGRSDSKHGPLGPEARGSCSEGLRSWINEEVKSEPMGWNGGFHVCKACTLGFQHRIHTYESLEAKRGTGNAKCTGDVVEPPTPAFSGLLSAISRSSGEREDI
jgi:hypothetical protein